MHAECRGVRLAAEQATVDVDHRPVDVARAGGEEGDHVRDLLGAPHPPLRNAGEDRLADLYEPGKNQPSFDKQFVRDWLETTDWDKNSTPPALPDDVVAKTREKYVEAYEQLTASQFAWK